jgi:putative membrane protein (TIGR04086 family)
MEPYKEKKSLDMLASAAVGGASASVLAVLLLTVTAALTLFSPDPAKLSWLGFAAVLLCCFTGSFIGARFTEKRPFVAGAVSGAMFIVTASAVALIIGGKLHPAYLPVTAACAIAGAFCGSIRRSKAKRIPAFDEREMRGIIKNKE